MKILRKGTVKILTWKPPTARVRTTTRFLTQDQMTPSPMLKQWVPQHTNTGLQRFIYKNYYILNKNVSFID
jgi:hypothetical protein